MINWQAIRFDALLYVCNLVVANFPSASLRHSFYRHLMLVKMAPDSHILSGLWLDCRGNLVIGENSIINQRCRLDARGGITIGASVSISPEVHIISADHDISSVDFAGRNREVVIGDYVFVGSRAMILPGVVIGKGAVVAAGAVVTKSVPSRDIVAGVPARKIGTREIELSYKLEGQRRFF